MRAWWSTLCALSAGCQLLGYDRSLERADASLKAGSELDARTHTPLDARSEPEASAPDATCHAEGTCGACGLGRYACEGTCVGGDATPTATSTLIDNWDDEDGLTADGNGNTYAFADGSPGTLTPTSGAIIKPTPGGAANSPSSAHVAGKDFTTFGAGLIVRLNTAQCAYDASTTRGIGFWIKGTATGNLFISAATLQTTDPKYCATGCNDHPFIQLPLNSEWTHYTLQWADLKQAGWGTPVPFDTSTLEYLQFSFLTNTAFDLYLDELNFY